MCAERGNLSGEPQPRQAPGRYSPLVGKRDGHRWDEEDEQDEAEDADGVALLRERGHVVEGRRVMEPDQQEDETGEHDPVEGLGDRPQGEQRARPNSA